MHESTSPHRKLAEAIVKALVTIHRKADPPAPVSAAERADAAITSAKTLLARLERADAEKAEATARSAVHQKGLALRDYEALLAKALAADATLSRPEAAERVLETAEGEAVYETIIL